MYLILTSKPGKYVSEPLSGIHTVEAYDYFFYGEKKAQFAIAEVSDERARVRVIEDGTGIVNDVPFKFFPKFETIQGALNEIRHLTTFGHMETDLRKIAAADRPELQAAS
jgi:hypothetical protein